MRIKLIIFLFGITSLGLFQNCCTYFEDCEPYETWVESGFAPVYSNDIAELVRFEGPQKLRNPGKIYVYQNLLLINDLYEGVHIYENSNPASPQNLGFIRIKGSADVAFRNGILYADQGPHLVSVRVQDLEGGLRIARTTNVFDNHNTYYNSAQPPGENIYYACPTLDSGIVIDWVEREIEWPCYKE
jgi:hypothetical protein